MGNGHESELYKYLSEVGIKDRKVGRIDFNPVDLDKALEALVADGDNFLLERMYSYVTPNEEDEDYALCVRLINPDLIPDISDWDKERKATYHKKNRIIHGLGDWTLTTECYNIETGNVEEFDPVKFHPFPTVFEIDDYIEDYRRQYNHIRKAKARGYELEGIEIQGPEYLTFDKEDGDYLLTTENLMTARQSFGNLVPGLE